MRLACLLTWLKSVTSGGPTAGRVRGVNAWCSRSVDVLCVVANQEHSCDRAVPLLQDRTGMENCSADCACAHR